MTDRGKMVNELTYQLHSKEVTQMYHLVQLSVTDAKKILALLKEQEPVKPMEGMLCGNCGCRIHQNGSYCYNCGRAVLWNG